MGVMAVPPPSTDWREAVAADEAERFERHAEMLHQLQRRNDARGKGRALHRKALLGARATLEVLGELPAEVRVGLFAAPGVHRAYVRFSNGAAARSSDRRPDVRGLAVKVLGVPGKKIIPGLEDATTQDFLFIQMSSLAFRDTEEFMAFVRAIANPLLALPRLLRAFGFRLFALLGRLRAALATGRSTLAGVRFYTALPIRMGEHAGKLSLIPSDPVAAVSSAAAAAGPDALADDLAARLAAGPLRYDLAVQLYRNDRDTPIEDASVEWKDDVAPWIKVGRLTIDRQDTRGAGGRKVAEYVERLSFDPWHALVEHRPLGDIMRARNVAYRVSTKERGAAPEPDGTETFE
ncbi:MAG TPA: hypothetical protein VKE22_18220 [Haliangiales bacterium]|nr:hypothetical protein [Haliangiales bacterium]